MSEKMCLAVLNHRKEIEEMNIDLSEAREMYRELAEAQEEVGGTVAYRIKCAAAGGKSFDILTGDDDMDTSVRSFQGIIIHSHKCNALFAQGDLKSPPICSSLDGVTGVNADGEIERCADCPHNEFGSAEKGKGKACKNMRRLYILTASTPIPFVLSLSPTSIANFQRYRLSSLAGNRMKPYEAITEFSLEQKENADGKPYSVVKFKLIGKLTGESLATAEFFAKAFKPRMEMSSADYKGSSDAEPSEERLHRSSPKGMIGSVPAEPLGGEQAYE